MDQIDFVIPWVDDSDPAWRKELLRYNPSAKNEQAGENARYRDWSLLRYWFRMVEKNAPWVHKVYFVTWGHIPDWLNTDCDKLVIINHKDYIPPQYLPTFNANTIELNFHRIPGLSEQFVYFNDDMFLAKPVKPTDFFVGGKPCDEFALDAIFHAPNSVGYLIGNDIEIINKYFTPRKQRKQLKISQYFNLHYSPKLLYRTAVLSVWPWFTGIYCDHLTTALLKTTYVELWEKENNLLDQVSRSKFREKTSVNQWLFKFWQLVTGNFHPRYRNFGHTYQLESDVPKELLSAIETEKYGVICINDTEKTINFEHQKNILENAFRKKYPQKSCFERV